MAKRTVTRRVVINRSLGRAMFDDGMYIVALVTPILTIPQLALIWLQRQTLGVSIVTWGAYAVMSGVWLIYGIVHKQKPLILSQACLFVIDFAVVLGVCLFRS